MSFALVKTGIAPLYTQPTIYCELADEALHGMVVELLEKVDGDWYRVRTHYRYEGYVQAKNLELFDNCIRVWQQSPKLAVAASYVDILRDPKVQAPCLVSVPRGAILAPMAAPGEEGWQKVGIADGRFGYTKASYLTAYLDAWDVAKEQKLRSAVVRTAMSYLGAQYRWGGKTPLGIDCSGLTAMAYLLNGVVIYRDASIKDGFAVHQIDPANAKEGDLFFFPGHVAMCVGGKRFIHSTAHAGTEGVVLNSLDPADKDFRADLLEKLTSVGSIF